ncbi:MAG: radical SAM/SPASM domain-containing protein [Desulfovibrio sp.]
MSQLQQLKTMNEQLVQVSCETGKERVSCFPTTMILSPSNKCNFRCKTCLPEGEKRVLETLDWSAILKLEPIMPYIRTLDVVGGEPLFMDDFTKILRWAERFQCKVETVTNGYLLDERWRNKLLPVLENIRVSVDGATDETYKRIRGHDLNTVLKNIAELSKLKLTVGSATPHIEINFVAMRSNVHELGKLVVLASQLGVRQINVIYMHCYTETLARESLYFYQDYSDAHMLKAFGMGVKLGVKVNIPGLFKDAREKKEHPKLSTGESKCSAPWHFISIRHSGEVDICCGGAPSSGNLNENTIEEIWNNRFRQNLRKVINTPLEPVYCKNCFHGGANLLEIGRHIPNLELAEKMKDYVPLDL